ncbi:hypothetical protein ACFC90_16515 [Enterococcus casseliflavus]|uniref:hypothetical protein n=1 Tax=Enterococcus casseliflavus TaxID=37734 RepID=UPI0039A5FABE
MEKLQKLDDSSLRKIKGGMGPLELVGYIAGYMSTGPRLNPISYSYFKKKKK